MQADKPGAASPAVPVAAPAGTDNPVDISSVLQRCGGDKAFLKAVITRFQSQAPQCIADIRRARGSGDGLRRAAHSLKSMAAYMGAERLADSARSLEEAARASGEIAGIDDLVKGLEKELNRTLDWLALHATSSNLGSDRRAAVA